MSDDYRAVELEAIAARYAHGECGVFALSVYHWFAETNPSLTPQLVLFFNDDGFVHCACRLQDGTFFDAYGTQTEQQLRERYNSGPLHQENTTVRGVVAMFSPTEQEQDDADAHLDHLLELLTNQKHLVVKSEYQPS